MTALPSLTGKKLLAALKRGGFDVSRVQGSHHFLRHPDDRCTVVPVHAEKPSVPVCLRKFCGIAN